MSMTVSFTVYGKNRDELYGRATRILNDFGVPATRTASGFNVLTGIVRIDASPSATANGGEVVLWQAGVTWADRG